MATIGTLQRLSAGALSKLILAEQASDPTLAIIDVRDDGEDARPRCVLLLQVC
jgi:hypothetical protein